MEWAYLVIVYLVAVNVYSFVIMGVDKRRAQRRRRRIPERTLFTLGAVGGAIGVWYGMKHWRHKTQHQSFKVGIPLLVAANIIVLIAIVGLSGMNIGVE